MLVNLVKVKKTFKTAKGEEKTSYNFYLKIDNGQLIAINPVRAENYNTFSQLNLLATELVKD